MLVVCWNLVSPQPRLKKSMSHLLILRKRHMNMHEDKWSKYPVCHYSVFWTPRRSFFLVFAPICKFSRKALNTLLRNGHLSKIFHRYHEMSHRFLSHHRQLYLGEAMEFHLMKGNTKKKPSPKFRSALKCSSWDSATPVTSVPSGFASGRPFLRIIVGMLKTFGDFCTHIFFGFDIFVCS